MSKTKMIGPLMLLMTITASGQQRFVYQVSAGSCAKAPNERKLTGFRVDDANRKGIFTALHGVAGCSTLTARSGGEIYTGLQIKSVDVDSDIALLSSNDLETAAAQGLPTPASVAWDQLRDVLVFGHPFGLSQSGDPLQVRIPALGTLEAEIPPGQVLTNLEKRHSPEKTIHVLRLDGPLKPGHSGAPILVNGVLIAVANGGLFGGTAGSGWAVLYTEIRLVPKNDSLLAQLAQLPVDGLFSFETGVTVDMKPVSASLKRVIDGRGPIVRSMDSYRGPTQRTDVLRFVSFTDCKLKFEKDYSFPYGVEGGEFALVPLSEIEVAAKACDCNPPTGEYVVQLTTKDGLQSIRWGYVRASALPIEGLPTDYSTDSFEFLSLSKTQADTIVAAFTTAIQACTK